MPIDHCAAAPQPLVLASASPRRGALLTSLGIDFKVDASNADEAIDPGLSVTDVVTSLAAAKALEVVPRHPRALIVAADTLVSLDGAIFGKPRDAEDAASMLGRM